MQINIKQLNNTINRGLSPIYLISSDVTLLSQQSRDSIKQVAKQAGFNQTELIHMNTSFDWSEFYATLQAYSLFSDKSCVDFRNPQAKFEKAGLKILQDYLAKPNPDKILIITTQKLTAAQKRSQWYKLIDKHGVILPIWPPNASELQHWIKTQLQQAQLSTSQQGIQLIAHLTEGNLLATHQAIEKLRLQYPGQTISEDQIAQGINDNSNFNVFDLMNYILQGNRLQTTRIINRLKSSGAEATLVLWALCNEIRTLIGMRYKLDNGMNIQQVLQTQWSNRKAILKSALSRHTTQSLEALLLKASEIDKTIKGIIAGNHWDAIMQLGLALSGQKTLTRAYSHEPA
ncbi:MAG: DNA polymerase III subunit delta [Gammaproteobacteria bacterium]|nr:DNA polymerase III subunit delta [Gammaproteobacteria bacterium]